MSKITSPSGVPIGTSTSPCCDRPGEGEDLGPSCSPPCLRRRTRTPFLDDGRNVGVGLDVVEGRWGLPHSPLTAGKGGRGRGSPRLPSMEFHERGLLAADEGAGAHADLQIEGEAAAEDVVAEQAPFAGDLDRLGAAETARWILGPDVDIAWAAPIAYAAMVIPSIRRKGSPSSTLRSMKAPGSPSSALQRTYLTSPGAPAVKDHFFQVGKPAPPRPRRPDAASRRSRPAGSFLPVFLPVPGTRRGRCSRSNRAG